MEGKIETIMAKCSWSKKELDLQANLKIEQKKNPELENRLRIHQAQLHISCISPKY